MIQICVFRYIAECRPGLDYHSWAINSPSGMIETYKREGDFMENTRKIVLIMADTQRCDMLGCYGNTDMKTPNIDRLASRGMLFRRAYTTQPVCGPARSAIFTGTYPHSNGSWGNSMPLGANVKTICFYRLYGVK